MPRIVLVDANIFFAPRLRDLFMYLRLREVIAIHWTREIEDEWVRNVAAEKGIDRTKLTHGVASRMREAVPDWEVDGFESYIGKFEGVDTKDQHVAAAAYKLSCEVYPDQPVALVTKNVTDFKQSAFAGAAVRRFSLAGYLSQLMRGSTAEVADTCEFARRKLTKPKRSKAEYVESFREHQCQEFANQLASIWQSPELQKPKAAHKRRKVQVI